MLDLYCFQSLWGGRGIHIVPNYSLTRQKLSFYGGHRCHRYHRNQNIRLTFNDAILNMLHHSMLQPFQSQCQWGFTEWDWFKQLCHFLHGMFNLFISFWIILLNHITLLIQIYYIIYTCTRIVYTVFYIIIHVLFYNYIIYYFQAYSAHTEVQYTPTHGDMILIHTRRMKEKLVIFL